MREHAENDKVAGSDQSASIEGTLRTAFGFHAFRDGQEAVVTRLLNGNSVLAIFPTGGGKSLCYQLPALMLEGLTLVISPLIALMKDQLDFLIARGAPAGRLDSSLTREETLALYDSLRAGDLRLLYISPERLGNERFLETLRRQRISLLAIDEAHCISEWGHNFRPDYLKIAQLAKSLEVERVLALTATATPEVANDIARAFDITDDDRIHTGFYRPNLDLRVKACLPEKRDAHLLSHLQNHPPGPTIIYVTLQRTAERVAAFLGDKGMAAQAYHAGMKPKARTAIQDTFMASKQGIIVATIAFGMGVDKSDIRYVCHYNLPKGLESYSQEIGRAGRDGQPSICTLFACGADVVVLKNFVYGDTPEPDSVGRLVNDLLDEDRVFDVSIYDLSSRYDIRPLVVKTLLTYLELEGVIESTGPFYAGYKFQPQKSSQEILARVAGERADFLRGIFQHAKKGKTWFTIDVDAVSELIGATRQRIVAALSYLEEVGYLVLQASGARQGYRRLQGPSDLDALCATLSERFVRREENDIARIRQMLTFAEVDTCFTQHLLAYFGEARAACGHCGRCANERAEAVLRTSDETPITLAPEALQQLLAQGGEAVSTTRQLARLLCGISSPATTREKLRGHPLFGTLEDAPFHQVLRFAAQHIGGGDFGQ